MDNPLETARFVFDVVRLVGFRAEHKHKQAALLDRANDRFSPWLARRHITRGNPALDLVFLQCGTYGVGGYLLFVRVADENVILAAGLGH
jgi:hypothetical protein